MGQIEEHEMDAYRARLGADVRGLVDKYRAIFGWDVPGLDEPLSQRLIVDAMRQTLDELVPGKAPTARMSRGGPTAEKAEKAEEPTGVGSRSSDSTGWCSAP